MKKFINIIGTVVFIVILKGCILAPVYLTFMPIVTAYRWGFRWNTIKSAIPFEFRCVWHTLCYDWRAGCEALIFNI